MKKLLGTEKEIQAKRAIDRIDGDKIILDGLGFFPKKIIIIGLEESREYELRKTSKGNYQLL